MKTFKELLISEGKLSIRGIDMFIFAICMPVFTIIMIGAIFGEESAFEGADYTFLEQSFGAVTTIAICAGGVMGLPLVISDYRNKKILKRYKVTPISPALVLVVQVVIYALYSFVSLLLVYLTAVIFFDYQLPGSWLNFIGIYFMVMIVMFSIGVLVGGIAPNMKVASTLASLLYFPMLLFSGATLPYEILPKTFQKLADVLPMTQGIKLLKAASLGLPLKDITYSFIGMLVLGLICTSISLKFFKWE